MSVKRVERIVCDLCGKNGPSSSHFGVIRGIASCSLYGWLVASNYKDFCSECQRDYPNKVKMLSQEKP